MQAQENTTYAIICDNAVTQLFTKEDFSEWNEENILAIPLTAEQVSWVKVGDRFDSASQSIIKPSLDEFKTKALEFVNLNFEYEVSALKDELLPLDEQLTWDSQKSEAKAFLSSKNPNDAPLLSVLANARGQELEALANKVLEKSNDYNAKIALLVGNRQKLQAQIQNAQSISELENLQYISPLKEA
ncbi:hypothetical protein CQA49_08100 [Helicobacter sp. MIT 00-7814]|nr:hypothetical protein [Helicobacter sp. MIT 00-7814]RDU51888.1 hypothetical protein CQA37_09250 [Helicobacter sp. MIT 99-10781]RDU52567.1 hypothetical protein CQA49_08100 [Helicobacter sp. MIT 00-7814]